MASNSPAASYFTKDLDSDADTNTTCEHMSDDVMVGDSQTPTNRTPTSVRKKITLIETVH